MNSAHQLLISVFEFLTAHESNKLLTYSANEKLPPAGLRNETKHNGESAPAAAAECLKTHHANTNKHSSLMRQKIHTKHLQMFSERRSKKPASIPPSGDEGLKMQCCRRAPRYLFCQLRTRPQHGGTTTPALMRPLLSHYFPCLSHTHKRLKLD